MSLTDIDNAEDVIRKGIIDLQKPQPFFAHLVMHLRPEVMSAEEKMQTVGVSAKGRLFYNKEFMMKNKDHIQGLLTHEVLHVAFLHAQRTGPRNKVLANIAQDVVVNMMLGKAGMTLPATAIPYDNQRDRSKFQLPDGDKMVDVTIESVSEKAWEEVYDDLSKLIKNPPQGGSGKQPGHDNAPQDDGGEGQEGKSNEEGWGKRLAEAAQYAKQQGKLPAGMDAYVDELLKPKVLWKQLLLQYLRPYLLPVDWSYQRPNKKSQALDVYMPSVLKEHCAIEVIIDTSGSIAQDELTEFLSEVVAIAKSIQHLKMWVSSCDTQIQSRYVVENGDIPKILSMQLKGGGGTSMENGLDYVKANNQEVDAVIVLTDGCDSYHKTRIDYPFDVLWVISKNGINNPEDEIPYGRVIKMDY
jgi:predicted metal-dependent peptidase